VRGGEEEKGWRAPHGLDRFTYPKEKLFRRGKKVAVEVKNMSGVWEGGKGEENAV